MNSMVGNMGARPPHVVKRSLKSLLEDNEKAVFKRTDFEIILKWIADNGWEIEAIDAMASLAKSKMASLESEFGYARTWVPMLPKLGDDAVEPSEEGDGERLYGLQLACALGIDLPSQWPYMYEWAKEKVPAMELKSPRFFRDTFAYLARFGIFFRNYPKSRVLKDFCLGFGESA